MERLTRLGVLLSLLAALLLHVALVSRANPKIAEVSLLACAASLGLAWILPKVGCAVVLLTTYLAPAAIAAAVGSRDSNYLCLWLSLLIGPMLVPVQLDSWQFPRGWKWPLILWLSCVALTWPFVVWRECDFHVALLGFGQLTAAAHLATSGMGITPRDGALGITRTVLTLGIPLLWLNWLFGTFDSERRRDFLLWVVLPLAASWCVCGLVGLYQTFWDVTFLNEGLFGYLHRASGTMLDANPFGVVSAMWGLVLFALAITARRQWLRLFGFVALALSWICVWASGSRTATGVVAVGLVVVIWYALTLPGSFRAKARAWAIAGVVIMAVTAVSVTRVSSAGSIARLRRTLPASTSLASLEQSLTELWNRDGYGWAATRIIVEHPWFGVGIGAFPALGVDYASLQPGFRLAPDNAQNWFRHQLAETGIVGGLGWIIWIGVLAVFFWRTSCRVLQPSRRFEAATILGALIGVAAVSMVGMPTANTAAALSLMVFLFWYVSLVEPDPESAIGPAKLNANASPAPIGLKAWSAFCAILLVFCCGTAYLGATALRPPVRAARFNWEYTAGFYEMEHPSRIPPFRWTAQSAVDVFQVRGLYLKLTFWVHHPDIKLRPVEVKFWLNDRLITEQVVDSAAAITEYVRMPQRQNRVSLESWVSRTWRPSDYGAKDDRELGLAIDHWTFVSKPPAGAVLVN